MSERRLIAFPQFATQKMISMRNFWQKFKKWIIGFLVGSTALAAGLGAIETESEFRTATISQIPVSSVLGTQTRTFTWEDENVGENLIIKTDAKNYVGFGGTRVYFQLTNASKTSQNVNLAFSLKPNWEIKSIQRFDGNENVLVNKTRRETIPAPQDYATTTGNPIPAELGIDVEYQDTVVRPVWTDLPLSPFQNPVIARKDVGNTEAKKQATDYILSGETKYYRADVRYPPGVKNEEFFIEAIGEDYGHLDPANWTYTQNFDGMTTGDLNGQDSWTANVAWDVQNTVVQAGANALVSVASASNHNANRTISNSTSGNVVLYMRSNSNSGSQNGSTFRPRDSTLTGRFDVRFTQNSTNLQLVGTTAVTLLAFSPDIWYKVETQYDTVANTAKARVDDGAWSSSITLTGSGDITDLFLQTNDSGSPLGTYYFDSFSDATPASAGVNKGYIIIEE